MPNVAECFDREESIRLQTRMMVHAKDCYFNARRAIMRLEDYETATYVEGFAATILRFPVEHAWIVRKGKIIDPTLPREVVAYFPAIIVEGREGLEGFYVTHGRKYSRSPLFHAFGWGGADHAGFNQARIQSDRYCRGKDW
jgi:hypothetical protein